MADAENLFALSVAAGILVNLPQSSFLHLHHVLCWRLLLSILLLLFGDPTTPRAAALFWDCLGHALCAQLLAHFSNQSVQHPPSFGLSASLDHPVSKLPIAASMEQQFNDMVEFVRGWEAGKKAPADVLAKVYGLYKQATAGDASGEAPAADDQDKKTKYEAWAANKGMSKEDAMSAYVNLIEEKKKEYGGC